MSDQHNLPVLQEIKDYLGTFNFFEKYVHGQWEGNLYVETHARRFQETLGLLPALPPEARVLELGAIPYYMTILLLRFLNLKVDPLSFFEFEQYDPTIHTVESAEYKEQFDFEYRAVNVEKDIFPCADGTYDLVLCCEILEHLLINPSHMLYEIHRVLRPTGYLLITTPNVLRWRNVFSLLKGRNIYDRYHGNGIYGRHNREYSRQEIAELLEANAFAVEWLGTRNVYGSELLNHLPFIFPDRRDNIFALARPINSPRLAFPENLYALMDEHRNVVWPSLVMGMNETGQLGRGWYDFEHGEPGFRWSAKEAEVYLKNPGTAEKIKLHVRSHHPRIEITPVEVTVRANGLSLGTMKLMDHSWQELTFGLDASASDPVFYCQITVSETWMPKLETNSEDARELGVSVNRIWLE